MSTALTGYVSDPLVALLHMFLKTRCVTSLLWAAGSDMGTFCTIAPSRASGFQQFS